MIKRSEIPFAKPVIVDAVVPVILKKELFEILKLSILVADGIAVPSLNVNVPDVLAPVGPNGPVGPVHPVNPVYPVKPVYPVILTPLGPVTPCDPTVDIDICPNDVPNDTAN